MSERRVSEGSVSEGLGMSTGFGVRNHSAQGNSPRALLERADRLLVDSGMESAPVDVFLTAYLAALRGAAAVIASVTPAPTARRRGAGGAWQTMARVAPEFAMWSQYFGEYSGLRAAVMSGVSRPITAEQVSAFRTRVVAFLHDVQDRIDDLSRTVASGRPAALEEGISRGLTA